MLGDGEILEPICGHKERENELQMSSFEFVNMTEYGLEDERYTTNLLPGMGLGKGGRGVVEFPNFKTQLTKGGLGFFEGCDGIMKNIGTLNRIFVKEGGDFPFSIFLEL